MTQLKLALLLSLLLLHGCQQGTAEKEAEAAPPAPAPAQPEGFDQMKWKFVERNRALAENPKLVEVINDANADDYLSAVTQATFSGISKLNKAQMEHNARIQSYINASDGAEDPKPISFEEFLAAAKMNKNNMKGLYPWQVYAYDEMTGKVTILEDRAEKKRMFDERGLDYPHQE